MSQALTGVLSALVTAVFLFLGTKFVARQTRDVGVRQVDVDQRKVDQEAFDRFVNRYEQDRQRLEGELAEEKTLLRIALKHINLLRGEMRKVRVIPPSLPIELNNVPWNILEDDHH